MHIVDAVLLPAPIAGIADGKLEVSGAFCTLTFQHSLGRGSAAGVYAYIGCMCRRVLNTVKHSTKCIDA